jgi:hypothetical protein
MFFKQQIINRIQKGIAFLDKNLPDWQWRIKLKELDLQYADSCVLGLLCGDFNDGLSKLDLTIDEAYDLGFLPLCQKGIWDFSWAFPLTMNKYNYLWTEQIILHRREERQRLGKNRKKAKIT